LTKSSPDPLLDAAARLFRRRGYGPATLRDIAKAAGLLPGSVFYRYRSKEQILLALMERAVARATGAIEAETATVADPIERVRAALRVHLRLAARDDATHALLYEWRSLSPAGRRAMVRLRDRYEGFWDGLLSAVAAEVTLRPGVDLKLVRLLGFGAMNWVGQWYSARGGKTPEEIADALWASMAFGILQPEGGR
jgi:TetR/AcrR family transcriptional regulator, cholesterol catabolism regulator